jgi:uncharacterized protein (TIGR00255 family)
MAVRSMTGYGKGKAENARYRVEASLRSVNHRYLEMSVRINSPYDYLEGEVRSFLEKRLHRGKVDMTLSVESLQEAPYEIHFSETLAKEWRGTIEKIQKFLGNGDKISVADLLRQPGVVELRPSADLFGEADKALLWEALGACYGAFDAMRVKEGAALGTELSARLERSEKILNSVEPLSADMVRHYREKLTARMRELLEGSQARLDEERMLQETALYAERSDVSEEIARFRSHVAQFRELLDAREPGSHGRTLDFLLQEMQRESSTLGAKARFDKISPMTVELRAEIEKLREQVRNVE